MIREWDEDAATRESKLIDAYAIIREKSRLIEAANETLRNCINKGLHLSILSEKDKRIAELEKQLGQSVPKDFHIARVEGLDGLNEKLRQVIDLLEDSRRECQQWAKVHRLLVQLIK